MSTRWDQRFLASTRGQVASLLRLGNRTVEELASELDLTDNAVRAHLAALERDALVVQGELRRSGGKPSFTYQLTPDAERLFPKSYGMLLNQVLSILSDQRRPEELEDTLREVGHRLAAKQDKFEGDLESRIDQALQLILGLGGAAVAAPASDSVVIQGLNCPVAAAVGGTPDACLIVETLLTDLIGAPVRQVCDQGFPPRCRFVVSEE